MNSATGGSELFSPTTVTWTSCAVLLQTLPVYSELGEVTTFQQKLYIVERKGDLRLPKNYKPICLLDVASKVISVIIADRCQSVLKLHGLDEQKKIK